MTNDVWPLIINESNEGRLIHQRGEWDMPDLGLILYGAVPILLVATGLWAYAVFILVRYEKTTGTVVGYRPARGARRSGEVEIVEFAGPDGKTIQFTEKVYSTRIMQWEGHAIKVLYDPNKPDRARISSFSTLFFMPLLLTVIGVLIILSQILISAGPVQKLVEFLKALWLRF
jgi:hypothetical protein